MEYKYLSNNKGEDGIHSHHEHYDPRQSMTNASWDNCGSHEGGDSSDSTRFPPDLNRTKLSSSRMAMLQQRLGVLGSKTSSNNDHGADTSNVSTDAKNRTYKTTTEPSRKRPAPESQNMRSNPLMDPEQMKSLLGLLRTDGFCGEFDPEAHAAYLEDGCDTSLFVRNDSHISGGRRAMSGPSLRGTAFESGLDGGTRAAEGGTRAAEDNNINEELRQHSLKKSRSAPETL